MRIMGFSVMWAKLNQPEFTTFRFPRKDTDWHIGERVQVVYRPRTKGRKPLFIADIANVETKAFDPAFAPMITNDEAKDDGFDGVVVMLAWLLKTHGHFSASQILNKITLRRVAKPVSPLV